jgi:hypothetical protein
MNCSATRKSEKAIVRRKIERADGFVSLLLGLGNETELVEDAMVVIAINCRKQEIKA